MSTTNCDSSRALIDAISVASRACARVSQQIGISTADTDSVIAACQEVGAVASLQTEGLQDGIKSLCGKRKRHSNRIADAVKIIDRSLKSIERYDNSLGVVSTRCQRIVADTRKSMNNGTNMICLCEQHEDIAKEIINFGSLGVGVLMQLRRTSTFFQNYVKNLLRKSFRQFTMYQQPRMVPIVIQNAFCSGGVQMSWGKRALSADAVAMRTVDKENFIILCKNSVDVLESYNTTKNCWGTVALHDTPTEHAQTSSDFQIHYKQISIKDAVVFLKEKNIGIKLMEGAIASRPTALCAHVLDESKVLVVHSTKNGGRCANPMGRFLQQTSALQMYHRVADTTVSHTLFLDPRQTDGKNSLESDACALCGVHLEHDGGGGAHVIKMFQNGNVADTLTAASLSALLDARTTLDTLLSTGEARCVTEKLEKKDSIVDWLTESRASTPTEPWWISLYISVPSETKVVEAGIPRDRHEFRLKLVQLRLQLLPGNVRNWGDVRGAAICSDGMRRMLGYITPLTSTSDFRARLASRMRETVCDMHADTQKDWTQTCKSGVHSVLCVFNLWTPVSVQWSRSAKTLLTIPACGRIGRQFQLMELANDGGEDRAEGTLVKINTRSPDMLPRVDFLHLTRLEGTRASGYTALGTLACGGHNAPVGSIVGKTSGRIPQTMQLK